MKFENYSVAKLTKPLFDDYETLIKVGTKVTIIEPLGPSDYIIEIAWPDDSLVGGHRFTTATCNEDYLEALPND